MAMVEPAEEIPIMVEEAAPEPDPAPVPRRPRHYDELADLIFGPRAAVVTESGPDDGPTKQPPSSATKRVAQDGQSDGEGGDAPQRGTLTARVSTRQRTSRHMRLMTKFLFLSKTVEPSCVRTNQESSRKRR